MTDEDDCARLADTVIEKFGKINLVAPFAGIIKDGLMVASDRETGKVTKKMLLTNFKAVIDINLTGVFLTVRECAERMINHNCSQNWNIFRTRTIGYASSRSYLWRI